MTAARSTVMRAALALSLLAFVALGLPDGALGIAWPSIRAELQLPLDALGGLLIAATVGYVASSFSTGWLLSRLGVGELAAASCALTALSLLGYATAPSWPAMLGCGLAAGAGAGAIDAGLNTWVAERYGARTLNLLHACYGLGTTVGPILMTWVLVSGSSWRWGYLVLASAQLALAFCFAVNRARWTHAGATLDSEEATRTPRAPVRATLRLRAARLGIASFFLYVGLEATSGAWLYSMLHDGRGVPMAIAGAALSAYWGGLLAGRLLFGLVPERRHPRRLPALAAAVAAAGASTLAIPNGKGAILLAAAALGVACGPIFPSLIAATPRRLGSAHAANGVGLQVAAAAIGQSVLPALVGVAARQWTLEVVPAAMAAIAIGLCVVLRTLS